MSCHRTILQLFHRPIKDGEKWIFIVLLGFSWERRKEQACDVIHKKFVVVDSLEPLHFREWTFFQANILFLRPILS